MAESILTSVAEQILTKVLSLAAEEVNLVICFKADLYKLAERLKLMQALLSDADTKQLTMESVRIWLKSLHSAAYDADAVLDEFTYELLRQKVADQKHGRMKNKVQDFFSPSTNPLVFRLRMAHKIRNVSISLDQIYEEAGRIGLKIGEVISSSVQSLMENRETHPFVDDTEIVGRKKDISIVLDTLVDSDNEKLVLPVICIVGMGGQGKTTLAQLVYEDDKVVSHFDRRIWVCVSDEFEVPRLLNQMVESLTETNLGISNIEGLINNLRKELKGKKYLLVLDDVWNEIPQKWDSMRNALLGIGGFMGSKILITTRSGVVASIMHSSLTHHLLGLSKDESWCLFKRKAFANGGATEAGNFLIIGRELVKRCGGVPLAIAALGGLLHSKKSEREWLSIQNSSIWDSPGNASGVLATLKLSYNHLQSSSLKRCFSYFSVFPKDSNINKDRTIGHWMALGFLNPPIGSDLSMEDIGNSHFNSLLWYSLLQDVEKDEYENIIGCKMHDLVHDLARQTAKDYWSIVEGGKVNNVSDGIQLSRIPTSSSIQESSWGSLHRFQTLYFSKEVSGAMLKQFRCLRVLILSSTRVTELPNSIGKLKHLRYLDIEFTEVNTLPKGIIKLHNLQTLRVEYLDELPKNFWNLISLRHFHLTYCSSKCLFAGVHHLTGLQTLESFVVDRDGGCHIEELGGLCDLRGQLNIYRLQDVWNINEARSANLCKKPNIDALQYNWPWSSDKLSDAEHVLEGLEPHPNLRSLVINNFRGCKFPSWLMMESRSMQVLNNLVRIEFESCTWCENISSFGHLRNLKYMKISGMNNLKCIGPEFYGTMHSNDNASSSSGEEAIVIFPSLRELTLSRNESLTEWLPSLLSHNVVLFPRLLRLEIVNCLTLKTIPSHFSSIVELRISGNNNGLQLEDLLRDATSLRRLDIAYFEKLSLPNNALKYCTSLQDLRICKCNSMLSLPDLQYLTRLSELTIGEFSKDLDYFPRLYSSNVVSSALSLSLKSLKLIGWPKVKSLPEQLEQLSSLRELRIESFDGLKALPDWLGKLSSLQTLEIWNCKEVTSMPTMEAMRCLTKLHYLQIFRCPLLEERCTQGSGAEWHKIAHIPERRIG